MSIKTMIMALAMTLTSGVSFAQNAKSVNVSFGVMYPQTVDATLSYEVGTAHGSFSVMLLPNGRTAALAVISVQSPFGRTTAHGALVQPISPAFLELVTPTAVFVSEAH